jgi:hypothetical protein
MKRGSGAITEWLRGHTSQLKGFGFIISYKMDKSSSFAPPISIKRFPVAVLGRGWACKRKQKSGVGITNESSYLILDSGSWILAPEFWLLNSGS